MTPAPPGAPPARPTLILQGVNFQSGRSVLTTSSYAVLDQVAGSLVANPEIRIEIAGYTDSTGRRPMNLHLSMARAAAVRAYLARRGVSPMRMPKARASSETATTTCRSATVRISTSGGASTRGITFGRRTGGGTGFIYDGPFARIEGVRLLAKSGGRSGEYHAAG